MPQNCLSCPTYPLPPFCDYIQAHGLVWSFSPVRWSTFPVPLSSPVAARSCPLCFPTAPLSETAWSTLPQREMARGFALQTGTHQSQQQGQEGWNGWRPSSYLRPPILHPLSVCLHHHQHLQRDLGLRLWARGAQSQGSQWPQGWGAASHCHRQNLIPNFQTQAHFSEMFYISRIS
jgi:hypothetical protein